MKDYEPFEQLVGYDASYRLDGKEDRVRLAYHPGNRIPVKDGKQVLQSAVLAK